MNRWPAPRGRALPGDEQEEELPDFADTLSSDIESTRSQYVDLSRLQGGSRAERELDKLRQQQIDAHAKELAEIRKQVALNTSAIKGKASRKAFEEFSATLGAKIDKRLDNNRNLILAAVAVIGGLLGWIKVKG